MTLDSILTTDQPISVLHLDVEGMEDDALRGASRIIAQWKPLVVVETKTGLLKPYGYRLVRSMERNHVYQAFSLFSLFFKPSFVSAQKFF